MKRSLFGISGVCAAIALVSVAYGQTPSVSETIPLKYVFAKDVLSVVNTTNGIEQITVDLNKNSVTVRGSRAAVAAFRAEVEKTDFLPILHIVKMRLVRYDVDSHGKFSESVVSSPIVSDMDGKPATVSTLHDLSGYTITVTPTKNADQTVTLSVEVRELGDEGEIIQSGKNTRRIKTGEAVRVTGMTNAADKTVRRGVQRGEIITSRGIAYTGYYVEAQAMTQPASNP